MSSDGNARNVCKALPAARALRKSAVVTVVPVEGNENRQLAPSVAQLLSGVADYTGNETLFSQRALRGGLLKLQVSAATIGIRWVWDGGGALSAIVHVLPAFGLLIALRASSRLETLHSAIM